MLVKLGDVWVDPVKVISISMDNIQFATSPPQIISRVETDKVVMRCVGMPSDLAAIVNEALNTQTYGGGPDEEEKPTT